MNKRKNYKPKKVKVLHIPTGEYVMFETKARHRKIIIAENVCKKLLLGDNNECETRPCVTCPFFMELHKNEAEFLIEWL